MKNLDFALRVMSQVYVSLKFNNYGPVCDKNYWRYCQRLIDKLPKHVQITYHGEVAADMVPLVLSSIRRFFWGNRFYY